MRRTPDRIASVADAIKIARICSDIDYWPSDKGDTRAGPKYKPPFGIWYRGQSGVWPLCPSIFRKKAGKYYDETSIYFHFQLRSPTFRKDHHSPFEWLCLMQHYGAPTRLLDWSESVLVGLYFTVWERKFDNQDGQLFVLNSRLLNRDADVPRLLRRKRSGIHVPESFNIHLRSLMAFYRYPSEIFVSQEINRHDISDAPPPKLLNKIREEIYKRGRLTNISDPEVSSFFEQMRKPVAVFPYRTNARLHMQQGVFTIHGGKKYGDSPEISNLQQPIGLDQFSVGRFLKPFSVPKGSKNDIRKELEAAGIHKGSLFPELDQQSEYMREIWR